MPYKNNFSDEDFEYLNNIVVCKKCGTVYNKYLKRCPKCKKKYRKNNSIFLILAVIVLLCAGLFCYNKLNNNQIDFINSFRNFVYKKTTTELSDCEKYNDLFTDNYYYKQLSDNQKKIYCKIYDAAINFKDKVNLYKTSEDVTRSLYAFQCEHPEFYWMNSNTSYSVNEDTILDITFLHNLPEGFDLEDNYYYCLEVADSLIGMCKNEYGIDQIQEVHDLICTNFSYNIDVPNSQNILCMVQYREGVCASYAQFFQLCLQRLGYNCWLVTGKADNIEEIGNHAWDMVLFDGYYSYIDVTWDDQTDNGFISHDYFMRGNSFLDNHFITTNYSFVYPSLIKEDYDFFTNNHKYRYIYSYQYE